MVEVKKVLDDLRKINGLNNISLLNEEDKDIIRNLEEENNIGVIECIERKYVIVLTHNSEFREPEKDIVVQNGNGIIFPALEFPEIKANNVVSSSPGINVHNYLRKKFSMDIDDEHATLLVGFNL
ncbi:hypothetical protein HYX15_02875 [Candidatus Woesearchaeota archaeon]|nr:hypothetical protein [Candidatus Woesearchaeota archaeon]